MRLLLTCVPAAWTQCTLALDPAMDLNQYAHTAWKVRDGFSTGLVHTVAQTRDGYLWLGTDHGLTRFDGVRNVPWQPPVGASLPDDRVRALLATRDGALWIGTAGGLASWNGNRLIRYPEFDGHYVNALLEDHEGAVWASGRSRSRPDGLLCAIREGAAECHGKGGGLPEMGALFEDAHGFVWVASPDVLWRWKPGPPVSYGLGKATLSSQSLSETAAGVMLALANDGIRQLVDGKVEALPPPSKAWPAEMRRLFRGRDGAFWIGTYGGGLAHFHDGRMNVFTRADGLSGDSVMKLFEDREGNMWVTTLSGIDRFRAQAGMSYSLAQGVPRGGASILADRDASVWLSTPAGLFHVVDGRMREVVAKGLPARESASLFQDSRGRIWFGGLSAFGYLDKGRFIGVKDVPHGYIDQIAGDAEGNVWIAHRDAGLVRVFPDGRVSATPWAQLGAGARAWRLAVDPVRGGLWLGYISGDVIRLVDGQVRESYSLRDGLRKGAINDLRVDADGTVWLATEGGLRRVRDGRIATLDTTGGLPCDFIHSTIEADDGSIWLFSACGLVRIGHSELDPWALSVDRGKAPQRLRTTVLDSAEGVPNIVNRGTFSPSMAKSPDGKLWVATTDGAVAVDPRHLPFNKLPPPVHVEQMVADRKPYEPSSQVRLPPLVRDLQIDYTALSLVAPEKVLFRYKLEGRDRDWQDAGNRRQAFYTDLDPGNYRFRVIACNNSGVWNEEGASLDFSVAPAYWQTNLFRALCALAFMALLWALYQLRIRHLRSQFNMTLDARVGERTRIARELHDTLLQSFQGLLLRFQTVYEMLPGRAAAAKETLGSAIDQTAQAITEGRHAVQGLRASTVETNDLALALTSLGEELAAEASGGTHAQVSIAIEGATRDLQPIVRDEVYRIAAEALRNAFRHAGAKQIEVELRYDARQLRLRIQDDGKGIAAEYLTAEGREGHFGLHGMRERAKLMGGKFTIWTAADSGTEIELTIPAANAYGEAATRRSWLADKLRGSPKSDK